MHATTPDKKHENDTTLSLWDLRLNHNHTLKLRWSNVRFFTWLSEHFKEVSFVPSRKTINSRVTQSSRIIS